MKNADCAVLYKGVPISVSVLVRNIKYKINK